MDCREAYVCLLGIPFNPCLKSGGGNACRMSGHTENRNAIARITHQAVQFGIADAQAGRSLFDSQKLIERLWSGRKWVLLYRFQG